MSDRDTSLEIYRAEMRAWLEAHLRPRERGAPLHSSRDITQQALAEGRALQRTIHEAGYLGITLPVEYGGQGLTEQHQRIWAEESADYEVPVPGGVSTMVTLGIILPTVLRHGSEEQKRDWIPKMLRGDELWAQLLSEPSAGSDLAGLRTRATRDGDIWLINGTKVWSSGALVADYGVCLARTNWDVPKHRGLTWFKVPLKHPHVTVRPIREINGATDFCEEFLDDVPVTNDMVIGAVDEGWPIANTLLAVERAGGSGGGYGIARSGHETPSRGARRLAPDLVAIAEARGLANDGATRQLIARAHTDDYMQTQLNARVMQQIMTGTADPSAASLVKLSIGRLNPRRGQLAMEIAGRTGIAWDRDDAGASGAALGYLNGRIMSIGGGSNQIQRNIISERLLGLPREPSFDSDKPFRDVLRDATQWSDRSR
jgi:alkylation response protein AidB-like acyl-CoA dehydrogenase